MRTVNLMNSVACVVGVLLLAGVPTDAKAQTVCLLATAAEPGQVAQALYGSGSGCVGYGVGLTYYPSDSSTLATNPDPMPPGLTTASFDLTSYADSASAFASLETATMSAWASSSDDGTQANSTAVFSDGLHFSITDGAPSAPVTVYIHLAGSQIGPDTSVYNIGLVFNFAFASFAYYTQSNPPGHGYSHAPTGFSSLEDDLTDSGFDITGTVDVTDGESTSILTALTVDCRDLGETCNYFASFNWDLPKNVTVTSDSGVFLSQ